MSTVFLAGRECPFSCVFCDLWQQTLATNTPVGAIPQQLERALEEVPHRSLLKLYNASNFFDGAAVPAADDAAVLALLRGFERVTVECHPHFVNERCFAFARRLEGSLEVAMGLETIHPEVLPLLNKKMTVADFDRQARELRRRRIAVRAFVLLGVPYLALDEQVEWCVRSVEHAAAQGADLISIIPVRGGNGALEALAAQGQWQAVSLGLLEEAFELARQRTKAVVQVDLWDLERLTDCKACGPDRVARLQRMNLSAARQAPVRCADCQAA
ncbi:radical SAM protein [bacterium]|nr:radical SAM protein [bacterium]